jgi:hypothetical protein
MQKRPKPAKMAEKRKKTSFFLQNYWIFTKFIVTLPQIFSEKPIKKIKRLIF